VLGFLRDVQRCRSSLQCGIFIVVKAQRWRACRVQVSVHVHMLASMNSSVCCQYVHTCVQACSVHRSARKRHPANISTRLENRNFCDAIVSRRTRSNIGSAWAVQKYLPPALLALWEDRKHTTRHQLVYNQFMYASCKQQL
jgi:hypothetical protein